ncbi:MAG TPA: NAD(P)-dependent oxidoreductase [Polyangiaceae bacterium]|jgi:nucleoside-diphosphate-sugar epimerase|nr:NAD(P)-dependent oxidoreductase [Polyangiaceae bacterium]
MRIFVTGSTGVIGRRVLPLLIGAGHEVTAMVHSPQKRAKVERLGAKAATADLLKIDSLARVLQGQEAVVNLATHIPATALLMFVPAAWHENDRIRREGSSNLVKAATAAGVRRFIQESFAPVYPDHGDQWIHETDPIEPVSYNRTVADAEQSAERFSQSGGAGVVLRFASFYGPDAQQMMDLVRLAKLGFVPVLGPSESFLSSISHDDAATAVVTALNVPAGIYNVGDDDPVSHRDYANAVADALNVTQRPRLPPPWLTPLAGPLGKMLARSLRISNMKLRNAGWAPRFRSVREGFRATVAEMNGHGAKAA